MCLQFINFVSIDGRSSIYSSVLVGLGLWFLPGLIYILSMPSLFVSTAGFRAWDLLLFVSSCAYLIPVDPLISNCAIWLWLVSECIGSSNSLNRRYLWPIAALLLLTARGLCLHEMPHPFSVEDVVIFASAVVVSSDWTGCRLRSVFSALSLALIPAIVNIGSQPWSPNPVIGSNQAGYLFGIFFIFCFFRFCFESNSKGVKSFWFLFAFFAAICIWQTDSRAALISIPLSLGLLFVQKGLNVFDVSRKLLLAAILLLLYWVMRFALDPTSGIPGMKFASDLGRLKIMECYFHLPFKTIDRFFTGFGLNYDQPMCQKLIEGNPMSHSHSLFMQVWSMTGLFGLIGLGLLAWLFLQGWLK